MRDKDIKRPVTGVFPYLRFAADKGMDTESVLRGTNLKESDFFDPQNDISLTQELLIVRNLMERLPAPETAWEFGRYFYSRAHGALGGMMECAPTVANVVACWIEYAALLHVYFRINLETVGDKIRLYAENQFNLPGDLFPVLLERDIIAGQTAIDDRLPGTFMKYATSISFAHPPRTDKKKYSDNFLVHVRFNQPHNYVEIKKEIMDVALPGASHHKFELFRQQCQAQYSLKNQERPRVTDSVKRHFQNGNGTLSFKAIAKKMNMSERSLREKLSKEGGSYRKIKNHHVFQQALNLMSRPELSIENIAESLGYSETCAFTRAFEKLAGMSPGRYRKTILSEKTIEHQSPGHISCK